MLILSPSPPPSPPPAPSSYIKSLPLELLPLVCSHLYERDFVKFTSTSRTHAAMRSDAAVFDWVRASCAVRGQVKIGEELMEYFIKSGVANFESGVAVASRVLQLVSKDGARKLNGKEDQQDGADLSPDFGFPIRWDQPGETLILQSLLHAGPNSPPVLPLTTYLLKNDIPSMSLVTILSPTHLIKTTIKNAATHLMGALNNPHLATHLQEIWTPLLTHIHSNPSEETYKMLQQLVQMGVYAYLCSTKYDITKEIVQIGGKSDWKVLSRLLTNGKNGTVDPHDHTLPTIVISAIAAYQWSVAKKLLDLGINMSPDAANRTETELAFLLAIYRLRPEIVSRLLKAGALPPQQSLSDICNSFRRGTYADKDEESWAFQTTSLLLPHFTSVPTTQKPDCGPILRKACTHYYATDVVKALLEYGTQVKGGAEGDLVQACRCGSLETVKVLSGRLDLRRDGGLGLLAAVRGGWEEIVRFLLGRGVEVDLIV
ncbi:hypothetical protein HK097_003910 [Rhizophlyctis rosea]|uniref:F-box domain-containing protein n=1 Tax=Rhizophlyctis rosea TaxID=64517 RepID=A0AAD5SFP7_9FUNG|nr:hypothetical protein HK097_003910 [Rhizophlyctis rosea]